MMFKRRTLASLLLISSLPVIAHAQVEDESLIPYGVLPAPPVELIIEVKPRTIQLLEAAVASETDLPRRSELVRDLGLCPVPESAAILKKLLTDPEPLIRAQAIRSLANIDAADEATLQPVAKDSSKIVQRELVRAKFAPAIIAGVSDSDAALQTAAVSASVNDKTDAAIFSELNQLSLGLQAIAIRTLGARKYVPAINAMVNRLGSEDLSLRIAAINGLASMGSITRTQIDPLMKHPHSAVRVAATRAAATLSEPDRIAIAKAALADTDLAVRTEGAMLQVYADASFVDTFFAQLPENYAPLRLAARDGLVHLSLANDSAKPNVTARAAKLLTDADPQRRIDGSFLLGRLKSTDGFAEHIKLLSEKDWHVVEQAARSLGPIGDNRAGEPLLQAALRSANDKSSAEQAVMETRYFVGEQAILSATMLRHMPVLAATKKYIPDKFAHAGVRNGAIYAVGVLATPDEAVKTLRPMLSRVSDPEESSQAISESIKAMGNARAKSMVGELEKLGKDEMSLEYQIAAHAALDRINGTQTPFVRKPETREATTTLRALDPNR